MSKAVKAMITAEFKGRYADTSSACVVDMTGMNVQEQESLRARLRERSARLEVVKNSLVRRAFKDGPLEPLGGALTGPCALVTSSDSVIEVAKTLVHAAKEFTQLKLKQAIFDGAPDLMTVEEMSRMKSQLELLGEVVMLIGSPGRALAACLQSPQAKIAGCLKAMADKAA
jgi:large subunit ribosomal protein L10